MILRTLLSLIFATIWLVALDAQTSQGAFLLGADFKPKNFEFSERGNFVYRSYNFGLKAAYFFKDNWLIGGDYTIEHTSVRDPSDLGFTSETNTAGLFIRKYFKTKFPKWMPFVGLGAGYRHTLLEINSSTPSDIPSSAVSGSYGKAELGLAYFLTEKVSFNLTGNALLHMARSDYYTTGNFRFGINYHFNTKKNE